jgi:phage shock protein E
MSNVSLRQKIQSGARVIDVRTPDEFADDYYPGAKNIPLSVLRARMYELEPKDKPIVLYCASGARSAQAARILAAAGFKDLVNAGGLDDMPR